MGKGSKRRPTALKLRRGKYIVLTYSGGDDWFAFGDDTFVKDSTITKVYGKLVGLKVQDD